MVEKKRAVRSYEEEKSGAGQSRAEQSKADERINGRLDQSGE